MSAWDVTLSGQALRDIGSMPWDPELELGGVVFGRPAERPGFGGRATPRSFYVRRVFANPDGPEQPQATRMRYDLLGGRQTIRVPDCYRGAPSTVEDNGIILGGIHSHPTYGSRTLSAPDLDHSRRLAEYDGRPAVSLLVTAGQVWEGGYPRDSWEPEDLVVDVFLVHPDGRFEEPTVHRQAAWEWEFLENQAALARAESFTESERTITTWQ